MCGHEKAANLPIHRRQRLRLLVGTAGFEPTPPCPQRSSRSAARSGAFAGSLSVNRPRKEQHADHAPVRAGHVAQPAGWVGERLADRRTQ
jgi:hypothetical protein